MRSAFSEYYASRSLSAATDEEAPRTWLRNWWEGERVRDYSKRNFGDAEGSHATPTEVSLTYHLHEPRFEQPDMNPRCAPAGNFYDADDYRRRFADGRIGSDPSLASAAHGKKIYEAALADVGEDLDRLEI